MTPITKEYKGTKQFTCHNVNCKKKVKKYYSQVKNKRNVYCSRECYNRRKLDFESYMKRDVQFHLQKSSIRSKTYKSNLLELLERYLFFLPECKNTNERDLLLSEVDKLRQRIAHKEKDLKIIKFKTMTIESCIN